MFRIHVAVHACMLVAVTAFLISATPRPCEAVEVGQIVEVRVETQALRGKQ